MREKETTVSDNKPKTVRGKATRDFTDATTERRFLAGKAHEFTEGEFGNFAAAGLVEAVDTADAAKTKAAT